MLTYKDEIKINEINMLKAEQHIINEKIHNTKFIEEQLYYIEKQKELERKLQHV